MQAWNQYLDYLIGPSFQWVNKVFVLTYEHIEQWTSYKWYFLPALKIKDYNVISMENIFVITVKEWFTNIW